MDKNYIKQEIDKNGFSKFFATFKNKKEEVEKLWKYSFPYDKLSEVFYTIYYDIDPPFCSKGNKKSFIDFNKGYRENNCSLSKNNTCYCLTLFRKNKGKRIYKNYTEEEKEKIKEKTKQILKNMV